MNYSIKLLRYSPTSEPEDNLLINHNYRMLIKVQQAIGLPPEIFLFQKNSKTTYEFISVCLPIDLLKYPAVDPATEDFTKLETRFFRHWQADIITRTAEELEDAWQQIITRTTFLIEEIKRLGHLSIAEVFQHAINTEQQFYGSGRFLIHITTSANEETIPENITGSGYTSVMISVSGEGEIS